MAGTSAFEFRPARRVRKDELIKAFRTQKCVDGSPWVLHAFKPGEPESILGDFVRPVGQANFERMNDANRNGSELTRFEILSLAARATFLRNRAVAKNSSRMAGNWLIEHLPRMHGEWMKPLKGGKFEPNYPWVSVDDLHAAIAEIVDEIQTPVSVKRKTSQAFTASDNVLMRRGLQIRACRIVPGRIHKTLNLSNVPLPFSLRFRECVIETPLQLDGCELMTLDLSGSALCGFDGRLLNARKGVRLRRTFSTVPIDLEGARIGGQLDATDCLVIPLHRTPRVQTFSADRGALNLSQVTVQNEVYLNRIRIWGGLNMRGAALERSLFMNGALLAAPVAILEQWIGDCSDRSRGGGELTLTDKVEGADKDWNLVDARLERPGTLQDGVEADDQRGRWNKQLQKLLKIDDDLAERLHPDLPDDPTVARADPKPTNDMLEARRMVERVNDIGLSVMALDVDKKSEGYGKPYYRISAFYTLLLDSRRARTSAFRGDGLVVRGSIFARRLHASGRFRMRYATVYGGVHFNGAWLRCIDAIGDTLNFWDYTTQNPDAEKLLEDRNKTFDVVRKAERAHNDPHALDINEVVIQGGLALSPYIEGDEDLNKDSFPTHINGSISATSAKISGLVTLEGIIDETPNPEDRILAPPKRYKDPTPASVARHKYKERQERAHIKLGLQFPHAVLGNDLLLYDAHELQGLNLENAKVAGDLLFSNILSRRREDEPETAPFKITIARRAVRPRGTVNLESATVDGDVCLPFFSPHAAKHTGWGVTIKAPEVTVGGRLHIYPALDPRIQKLGIKTIPLDPEEFRWGVEEAAWKRSEQDNRTWLDWASPLKDKPAKEYIDLRGASAASFCHLPTAWPDQGRLSISGFTYQRCSDYGPLSGFPSLDKYGNRPRITLLNKLSWVLIGTITIFPLSIYLTDMVDEQTFWLPDIRIWLLCTLPLLLIIAKTITELVEPYKDFSRPMAIEWLSRQMHGINRFKHKGVFRPLDPYVQAAKALREEGRYVSANEVELARFRRRVANLSMERHALIKAICFVTDKLSGYGFRLGRAAAIVAVLILTLSLMTTTAAKLGAIESSNCEPTVIAPSAERTGAECRSRSMTPLLSVVYAADIFLPVVEMGQKEDWKVVELAPAATTVGERESSWLSRLLNWMPEHWIARPFYLWTQIFAITGAVLVTMIASMVGLRAASAFTALRE